MQKTFGIHKIAFLGNYLPRKCGIATFTTDLRNAIAKEYPDKECLVLPINDLQESYDYPAEVRFEIEEQEVASYQRAADFLNITGVDILCLQHEFGIYGGIAGSYILALLHNVRMPIVTTLHTILQEPSPEKKRVMLELIELSTRLVVMTEKGRQILIDIYDAPAGKIDLIPHGIPDMPFSDPNYFKDEFQVSGRNVLLTFGLLSPNKGIEYVIRALPGIIKNFPNTVFIVVGQTHPNLIIHKGEIYRLSLERLAKDLAVDKHVVFFNRFLELEELKRFIGATDIYITPYLTETQITSGTLAYAFGAGNAVISTPYWHATELLDNEQGKLVPFKDAKAIEMAVIDLLQNETLRHSMRKKAYKIGRNMVWSRVGTQYLDSFSLASKNHSFLDRKHSPIRTLNKNQGHLPTLKLNHLFRLSDSTGIFQHAKYTIPNFHEGYCTDDNSRAFLFTLLLQQSGKNLSRINELSGIYLAFINYAFDRKTRRFRNFMTFDRKWVEEKGSEDCTGQALWALGYCVGHSSQEGLPMLATDLFEQALPIIPDFTSPRAWAFTLLGINEYLHRFGGDRRTKKIRETLTGKLLQLYKDTATENWLWFEDILTYANAKLSHSLIISGHNMNNQEILDLGYKTLRWLIRIQTSDTGSFRPIGTNGFFKKGEERTLFDQQPIDAQATISACIEAYYISNDKFWITEANRAFEWFLGRNDLGLVMYDSITGGCSDGLHVDRSSQNEGAESTLAFLLSLIEMKKLRGILSSFKTLD